MKKTICNIIIYLSLSFTPIVILFAFFGISYLTLKSGNIKNEIVYILPKVLVETNRGVVDENMPEEVMFKKALSLYRYTPNVRGEFLNRYNMFIAVKDGKLISFYDKEDVEEIEDEFMRETTGFKINKECKENICSITIAEM